VAEDAGSYGWPEDPEESQVPSLGRARLILLYGLPFVILLMFPAVAWIGLLPGAVGLRWATHPPHRRRLVILYVLAGLISVAPWIAWLLGRDSIAGG
jgi:hypothetical protein